MLVLAIGIAGTRQWDETFRSLQVALIDQQVDRYRWAIA